MIFIVAAMAQNGVIGNSNKLPWHYPEDLKRFRKLTDCVPIIMGRKTFESIGHPLPNRTNIVVSSRSSLGLENGVALVNDIDQAIRIASLTIHGNIAVIGGAEIYRAFLEKDLIDRIYLTIIPEEVEGDAYFPTDFLTGFTLTEEINSSGLRFQTLERNRLS